MYNLLQNEVKSLGIYYIHSTNVMLYGVKMFQILKQNSSEFDNVGMDAIETGFMLHDIGKLAIPQNILNKEGKLSDSEYDIVKKHTDDGLRILEQAISEGNYGISEQDLQIIKNMIKYHHERIDGHGYNGLQGISIPNVARLCAISDTYDAVISKRPYKQAYRKEFALSVLANAAGSQLDAYMVNALLNDLSWTDVQTSKQ